MSAVPGESAPGKYTPKGSVSAPISLGRQDYISVLLRLVGMELYKLRRRVMSKVLSIIALLSVVLVFLLIALVVALFLGSAQSQLAVRSASEPLRLPLSLYVVAQVILPLGQVLIIILAGAIVGGEYAVGTIRLMFTRGPGRIQFLLAKVIALVSCIVLSVVGMTVLGILLGSLLNLITGVAPNFVFITGAWLGHALLYMLITMLALFMYAMMAFWFATLGRVTAAGMAGALVWNFLAEPVLKFVFGVLASVTGGAMAHLWGAVPDYFISNNISTLLQNQGTSLFGLVLPGQVLTSGSAYPLSDLHALLVLVGYLILFIGLSWWITVRRDVTN